LYACSLIFSHFIWRPTRRHETDTYSRSVDSKNIPTALEIMLAVLPFDVLCLVIDNFTIPRNGYHRNFRDSVLGYDDVIRDIRSTLASLCLTSKTLRQIARPLLLAYLPIDAGSPRTKEEVLELHDISQALSYIRTIFVSDYFDEYANAYRYLSPDEKLDVYGYSRPLMKLYSQACNNLKKLTCCSDTFPLNAFAGSSLC